jgi:kinesin family protein 2/24
MKNKAAKNRSTSTTFKNDTSSRSHAICRIKLENVEFKSVEPGELYFIDLAGSESLADSQFHDKALLKQTKEINKSLMCLKECIRNRALQAMNPTKQYHIPYRNSKLTLVLKESLELKSFKHCKTTIIANVSPTVCDGTQTKNTLRYITPIKIGASEKVTSKISENDETNPATWDHDMLAGWV